ncbi:ATP-binding cassette domain-containing protein, partial [Pseudomonas aeruginosa]|uniref:ATP-binding cassette domain-containing protein n=1 Tax=Pseudomonas aeruginosa TaxID=287 RepID=UPI002E79AB72
MIEFKNVSKHFGPTQVLHNIDLNIAQGEVVVIIGPSGSGKSTLLRCINKLEEITSGDLIVDGLKVNDPKVDERLIRQEAGMVFQQSAGGAGLWSVGGHAIFCRTGYS